MHGAVGPKFDRGSESRPDRERYVNYFSALHCDRSAIAVSIIITLIGTQNLLKTGLDTLTDSSEIDVTMSNNQTLKKARGGTKSCTECK